MKIYMSLFYLFVCLTFSLEAHDDFVVFAPPKCGTHLIVKVLEQMLGEKANLHLTDLGPPQATLELAQQAKKAGRFIVAHNFDAETLKTLAKHHYKVIFILRDPRDQLVSMQNWMLEGQWNWIPVSSMPNPVEQIEEMITGKRYHWQCYEGCIGKSLTTLFLACPKALIFRFENLVGEEGGGSRKAQLKEIKKIANTIHCDLTDERAQQMADEIFGGTVTFRKGQIGQWKEVFQPHHKKIYKKIYGQTLILLGYEENLYW